MQAPDETVLAEKRRRIAARLALPWWQWPHAVWDGELRKHLRKIADRLDAAITDDAIRQRLGSIADFDPNELDLDSALALSARLDELVIESAGPAYLCSMVEAEFYRGDMTPVTWKKLYGDQLPEALAAFRQGGTLGEQALTSARNRLKALSHTRYEDYLLLRTRQSMKSLFLVSLGVVLLLLVALFAWAITRAGSLRLGDVMLVGAAGAIGAVMSGTLKVRDAISHINELRALRPAIIVQPLLGVASALVFLLALETGVVTLGPQIPAWAARGLLGFLAGFSEPFFLSIVERVTNFADRAAEKAASGNRPSRETEE